MTNRTTCGLFRLMVLVLVFMVQSESFATDIYVSLDGRAQADGSPAVALGIEPLDTSKLGRIKDRSLRVSDGTVFVPKDYQSRQRRGSDRQAQRAALAKERVEYYLACYLIGAQPYSYFQYGWGWTLASGSLHDFPELLKPLGAPNGSYQRTTPDGWEFTREFEHASVWVNTETGVGKITWR